jgi:hypothetical protein
MGYCIIGTHILGEANDEFVHNGFVGKKFVDRIVNKLFGGLLGADMIGSG